MKFFKVDGQWSIDDDEKKQRAGTLSFSRRGLKLKLLGSFRGGWSPTAGSEYPVIKGIVEKNPFGSFVTLYHCFTTSTSINHAGVGSESIFANRAILGDDHPPQGSQDFESLSLRFTHLGEWVGWKNYQIEWGPKESIGIDIHYQKPENISFTLNDVTLKIGTSFSSSEGVGRAIIKEKTHILVEPIADTPAEQAGDRYAHRLQNLLTFATDAPNENNETLLYGEKVSYGNVRIHKKFHLFATPVFRHKGKAKPLFDRDMLFTLDDARNAGVEIFQKWFDLVKRHEAFTIVYFAHIYRRLFYMDDRFRSLITAINVYCLSAFQPSQRATATLAAMNTVIGTAYDERERSVLEPAIPVGQELDLPFHLMRLLEENAEVMGKIISGDFFPNS